MKMENWEEEVRKKCASILRYKHELEKLYELYKGLPVAYTCPFCGYVSYTPLNTKIEVWVRYDLLFGDDVCSWSKKLINFCNCPKCKPTPEKCGYIRDGSISYVDIRKVGAKEDIVMTREYKQLLNDISAKMRLRVYQDDNYRLVCEGDGFKIREDADGVVFETETGFHCCLEDLPEDVGKLVWTVYYLVGGQVPMIDEIEVRPE